MEKTIGNYTGQPNRDFPLDCETLASLAENQAMAEILGNICGDKTILLGCELNTAGTSRGEGYVFLRTHDYPEGEVLRWTGGAIGGGLHVETVDVGVTADGYQYPKAYTTRRLVPGLGTEAYSWEDFAEVSTNQELARKVKELEDELARAMREPVGIVKMWAGTTIPEGYLLCNGQEIPVTGEYAGLYAEVGPAFNTAKDANGNFYTTAAGYFRVPDLRGRFIVGHNASDTEYNTYGKTGGEKKHTLEVNEMPSHSHGVSAKVRHSNDGGDGYWQLTTSGSNILGGDSFTCDPAGSGQSHENRPPYYVLAYIIKAK